MKKLAVVLTIFALLLSACATSPASTNDGRREIRIGFSFASKEGVIYQAFEDYIKKAAEEYGAANGVNMTFTFTVADADVGKQASNIEDLISQQPDLIVMMPQDSKAIVASIKAAHAAGVKVMTYNRAASPDAEEQADAHVGLDSVDQAYTTAVELINRMKANNLEPKIINVMGDLRDENAVNRDKGLKQATEELGAVIVQDVPTDWNPDKALSGLAAALQAHPEANAVFVASDFLMPGVQAALERAGKWAPSGDPNHMFLGSQDVFPSGAKLLKDGYIDVNTAFDIWPMSTNAVEIIDKLVKGEAIENTNVLIKGRVVTADNLEELENLWANDYEE